MSDVEWMFVDVKKLFLMFTCLDMNSDGLKIVEIFIMGWELKLWRL